MIEALSSEFEVLSEVGRGGMGVVYKARQISLDRIVAIKMLLREFARDDEFINRFKREAKAIAALNHQNIVDIYDIREAGGTWFIITEFVGGGTLRDLLKEKKVLSINEATRILYDSCSALYYTHKKGIIHRDIKPDNVMFTDAREVKVTDFGLARLSDSSFQTRTGLSMGTPRYMSPEQASGKGIDHRSDIYSLGVMFFEMATGQVPFEGDNAFAVVFKHINEEPPKPSEIKPDLPQWVDEVVLKCMAKDQEDRYSDCSLLGQALEGVVSTPARVGWTRPVDSPGVPDATIQVTQPVKGGAKKGKAAAKGSKKPVWLATAAVGVLAAIAAVLFFLRSPERGQPPVDKKPAISSLVETAESATEKGQWEEAAALWDRVAEETALTDPNQSISAKQQSATAWVALGKQAESDGKIDKAYRYYNNALERNPKDKNIVESYTRLRIKVDEELGIEEKIQMVEAYLEDKEYVKALEELNRLEKQGAEAEALNGLMERAKAGVRNQELASLLKQARTLADKNQFGEARSKLSEILKSDPKNAEAKALLGRIDEAEKSVAELNDELKKIRELAQDRKVDQAIASCERLRSAHPQVEVVQNLLRELKEKQENIAEAKTLYASARQNLQQGRAEKAYSELQDALSKDPKHKEASLLLKEVEKLVAKDAMLNKLRAQAQEALRKKDYATAIAKAQEILQTAPGDSEAEQVLTRAKQGADESKRLAQLAELKQKLADLDDLLRSAKYEELQTEARELAGEAGTLSGSEAAEIQERATALVKVASTVPSLIAKAESGLNKRDQSSVKAAIKACEEALKLNPSDAVASRFFSLATQQLADIEADLESALSEGKNAYDRLDLDGAKRQFDKALGISPNNEEAQRYSREIDKMLDEITSRRIQGTTWFSQREYAKAKKEFEKVLKILPGDMEAAEMVAKCDEAIERSKEKPPETTARPDEPTDDTDQRKIVEPIKVSSDYVALDPIKGTGVGKLQEPVDVYASPEAIYVVDSTLCQVLRFSLEGEFASAWGTKTKSLNPLGGELAPGEFSRPVSVAVDREENVYVLDNRGRCVQKFNNEGSFLSKFGSRGHDRGGFDDPTGLTLGSDGSVFVLDSGQCKIQKFTSDGEFLTSWGSKGEYTKELQNPTDICGDWAGFIYVTDTGNRRVQKYNLEGSYITAFPLKQITSGKHIPVGLGVDSQNSVYLSDGASDQIQKFTKLNRFVSAWGKKGGGKGELRSPQGITVTPKGVVLVANPGNSRVERYAPVE